MKARFLLVGFLFLTISCFSQSARIEKFTVTPASTNDKVLISWTMRAGATCPNVEVERTTDTTHFKTIYIYPAVCGSSDSATNYSWVDASPVPFANNYYRLKLDGIEFTPSILFANQVLLAENNVVIYPNPAKDFIQLIVKNPQKLTYDIKIYTTDGKLIFYKLSYKENSLLIDTNLWLTNTYTLQVLFENELTMVKTFQIID